MLVSMSVWVPSLGLVLFTLWCAWNWIVACINSEILQQSWSNTSMSWLRMVRYRKRCMLWGRVRRWSLARAVVVLWPTRVKKAPKFHAGDGSCSRWGSCRWKPLYWRWGSLSGWRKTRNIQGVSLAVWLRPMYCFEGGVICIKPSMCLEVLLRWLFGNTNTFAIVPLPTPIPFSRQGGPLIVLCPAPFMHMQERVWGIVHIRRVPAECMTHVGCSQ